MPETYEISSREKPCSATPHAVIGPSGHVFQFDPLEDSRWKTFVGTHPGASVFHQVGWLNSLKSCYGYVPMALTLSPPGSPLENGIVLCEVTSPLTGKRLVSVPFSDHCEPLINDSQELECFLANLSRRVGKDGWKYFELRPILHAPDDKKNLDVSQDYFFHRLDLRPSEQTLFKKFHKDSVQRKIRRAEREGLRYEQGNSEVLLQQFFELMVMTRKRQGLPPQPFKWFRTIISCMEKNAQIRVALKADTPVASILTLTTERSLVYKYGCSDVRFGNLGGTALLFWNAIQQAKADGLEELDMGRSDMANTGLITFKEHWGAERSALNYWRYPLRAASSKPERRIRYFKKLISIAPDRALVALGNLLYRHLG
jgi:Acetyltransferase (GNAT) domain